MKINWRQIATGLEPASIKTFTVDSVHQCTAHCRSAVALGQVKPGKTWGNLRETEITWEPEILSRLLSHLTPPWLELSLEGSF